VKKIVVTDVSKIVGKNWEEKVREIKVNLPKKGGFARQRKKIDEMLQEWQKHFPRKGDVLQLQNAQVHFCYSGIFVGWDSYSYGRTYCLDVDSKGKVHFGTIQNIGHINQTKDGKIFRNRNIGR